MFLSLLVHNYHNNLRYIYKKDKLKIMSFRRLKRVSCALFVNIAAGYYFAIPATHNPFLLINDTLLFTMCLYAAYRLESGK